MERTASIKTKTNKTQHGVKTEIVCHVASDQDAIIWQNQQGLFVCVRARMRDWAAEPPLVRVHTRFLAAVWGDDCWGWWMWFSAKPVRQPMYTGTSQSASYAHTPFRNSLPDSYRVSPDNVMLQRFDGFCAAPHPATCQRVNACAPTSAFNMRPKRSGRPSVFLLSETHVLKEFCRAV